MVTDYSKDEGGVWYGICFTNYLDTTIPAMSTVLSMKLYGRKVHQWINGFLIGIDNEYITDSCLKVWRSKVSYIGNARLDANKIKIVSERATDNYERFLESFKIGRERRLAPPDNYRAHFWKMESFRPDENFPVSYFASK